MGAQALTSHAKGKTHKKNANLHKNLKIATLFKPVSDTGNNSSNSSGITHILNPANTQKTTLKIPEPEESVNIQNETEINEKSFKPVE